MKQSLALNPLIKQVEESSTLEINRKIKQLQSNHKKIIRFGFGESPFPVPKPIRDALEKFSFCKSYLPGEGLPELRDVIAQYYNINYNYLFTNEDVFVAPGSKESIFHLLYLLEGDLILPKPSWVSYAPQARLLNKAIHHIASKINNSYSLSAFDLDIVCQGLSKYKQKILILNSPNNPTGCSLSQKECNDLAAICRANNIIVISDEIYVGTEHKKEAHSSIIYPYPEGTIVTSGLSKLFSAGGYRFGFCLIPECLADLKKALKILISETYSCVSSPVQYAAMAAYGQNDEIKAYVQACAAIHKIARDYLYHSFISMGLNCAKPDGAFYLMPDFRKYKTALEKVGIKSDQQLASTLLNEYSVATLPGSDFGMSESDFCLRIASVDYEGKTALDAFATNLDSVLDVAMPNLIIGCQRIKLFLDHVANGSSALSERSRI